MCDTQPSGKPWGRGEAPGEYEGSSTRIPSDKCAVLASGHIHSTGPSSVNHRGSQTGKETQVALFQGSEVVLLFWLGCSVTRWPWELTMHLLGFSPECTLIWMSSL